MSRSFSDKTPKLRFGLQRGVTNCCEKGKNEPAFPAIRRTSHRLLWSVLSGSDFTGLVYIGRTELAERGHDSVALGFVIKLDRDEDSSMTDFLLVVVFQ